MTAASDVLPGAARPLPAPRPVTDPVTKPAATTDAPPEAQVRATTAVREKAGELTAQTVTPAVQQPAAAQPAAPLPKVFLFATGVVVDAKKSS